MTYRVLQPDTVMAWRTAINNGSSLSTDKQLALLNDLEAAQAEAGRWRARAVRLALALEAAQQENRELRAAVEELEADNLTLLEVRNLALGEAAADYQPGPDGQDYMDRE